jgi:hypothetical protein
MQPSRRNCATCQSHLSCTQRCRSPILRFATPTPLLNESDDEVCIPGPVFPSTSTFPPFDPELCDLEIISPPFACPQPATRAGSHGPCPPRHLLVNIGFLLRRYLRYHRKVTLLDQASPKKYYTINCHPTCSSAKESQASTSSRSKYVVPQCVPTLCPHLSQPAEQQIVKTTCSRKALSRYPNPRAVASWSPGSQGNEIQVTS